ncbi:hypothetical protein FOJ82_00390 [Tessaracoccus rhinocerotis]|uniref:Uncharacterized protein n=1 Tax=Tessaracoccus rhinocerotis TaxID=1689449 RepID=A0A553K3Y3_9ACTN|nr:hypothetical protein FOJ82_00390 [Tessaracoccus rhinocerotis]
MFETAVTAADTAEMRKARGAFFTPEPIARYVTDWAVRASGDTKLGFLEARRRHRQWADAL